MLERQQVSLTCQTWTMSLVVRTSGVCVVHFLSLYQARGNSRLTMAGLCSQLL